MFIVVAVIVRITVAFFVTYNKTFSRKERFFIAVTWIPKATVQASLCSIFLTDAKAKKLNSVYIEYGNIILTSSILAILITAPIGSILMNTLGPILLPKDGNEPDIEIEDDKKDK